MAEDIPVPFLPLIHPSLRNTQTEEVRRPVCPEEALSSTFAHLEGRMQSLLCARNSSVRNGEQIGQILALMEQNVLE